MAEDTTQDQAAALTEKQAEEVRAIATEVVRAELAQAEKTPSDRLRDAYKPAA